MYKILDTHFTKGHKVNGGIFHYDQLIRDENKAVYKVSHQIDETSPINPISYEVIKVIKQKEMDVVLGGVSIHYEAKEAYPSKEQWGKIAWSYSTEQEAMNRYNEFHPEVVQARGRPKKVV